jgi:hypothetical protein
MFNLKQELTVNLIGVKPVNVEGKSYLTLWVYQQADGSSNNAAIGGEVMKLSAEPSLESEFKKLFTGVTAPIIQCDITAELRTGAANSTKLYVVGVKASKQPTNSTAKAV